MHHRTDPLRSIVGGELHGYVSSFAQARKESDSRPFVAALRGERDIAVGNVVGSNTFNILCVLGLSALVAPTGLTVPQSMLTFDLPVMIAVAVACLPIFFTGNLIARWEGALFLAYYAAYTVYLVLAAQRHDALATYGLVMTTVVLPLTAVSPCWWWRGASGGRAWRCGCEQRTGSRVRLRHDWQGAGGQAIARLRGWSSSDEVDDLGGLGVELRAGDFVGRRAVAADADHPPAARRLGQIDRLRGVPVLVDRDVGQ